MPVQMVWAVATTEVVGSVYLIEGVFGRELFTWIGTQIVIVIMPVTIGMVHAKNGWNVTNGGMEFQVLMPTVDLHFAARVTGKTGLAIADDPVKGKYLVVFAL